eukprot:1668410-Prymnesium_polylepis.2
MPCFHGVVNPELTRYIDAHAKEFCTICFPEIDEDGITLIAPLKTDKAGPDTEVRAEASLEKRVTAIKQVLERQAAALEQQALLLLEIHDSVVMPESVAESPEVGKLRVGHAGVR